MSRRRLVLALLLLAPAACGRRGKLRLPSREEGGEGGSSPTSPAPAGRSAPERRAPRATGLEIG
ncbi:MAG: hypothetical protein KatS3mg117_3083 [Geminicoccaceae bacterium]|nr:MAG: hypothetical protein KatS3mg117_3083 [Geminicoccaceae bacterium]